MKNKFQKIGFICSFILASSIGYAEQARFLVSDQDAIQARVDVIQQAEKEILVEYFSVWNDDQSLGGMALLLQAARKGIKVKVILDSLSSKVPPALFAGLIDKSKDASGTKNLEIKVYNPASLNLKELTHRDHAKMLIVDGKILITGGRNVGDKYFGINQKRNFNDLDVLVKGRVVSSARDNFLENWNSPVTVSPAMYNFTQDQLEPIACAGREDFENCQSAQKYAELKVKSEMERIQKTYTDIITKQDDDIVQSETHKDWFGNSYTLYHVRFLSHNAKDLVTPETAYLSQDLLALLMSAKEDVNIVSPYLIPTDHMMQAFGYLLAKGVRVRVITNSIKSTDNLFAQAGYRSAKDTLVKMGVEIYEYKGPDTIHAKTAIIDHQKILIGTYNMDPRSAFLNREIGLIILDLDQVGMAKEHEAIIEHFRSKSVLVAKGGKEYNQEWQSEGVSTFKKSLLKSLMFVMPLIKSQI